MPATLQCACGPTSAQPVAGDLAAREGRKLDGEVRWHVEGPSRAIDSLRAIVTLRTAVLLAGADMARTPGDEADAERSAISLARVDVLRSVTAAPKLSMALDGPSTCHLTSPFPMSSPPPPLARRGAGI